MLSVFLILLNQSNIAWLFITNFRTQDNTYYDKKGKLNMFKSSCLELRMNSFEIELNSSIELDKCLFVEKIGLANSQDCYRMLRSFRNSNTYPQIKKLGSRLE